MSHKPRAKAEADPKTSEHALVKGAEASSNLMPEMEGIAAAMTMQAEILKRLHDQQQKVGEMLQDTRRSEMMIQSTAALNDSFTGMRRVQEKLLDRLAEPTKAQRSWVWLVVFGLVILSSAIVFFAWDFGGRIDEAAGKLAKPDDAATQQLLSTMEERIRSVESSDRQGLLKDLDRLRGDVRSAAEERSRLHEERTKLIAERDRAIETLGAEKADNARTTAELQSLRTRAESAEKELARMTERALADQKLIGELNKVVEGLRERAQIGAPVSTPKEKPAEAATPVAETGTEKNASSENPNAASNEAPKGSVASVPITPEVLSQMNLLLSSHRGSDIYNLTNAQSIEGNILRKVQLAVRGQDGSLAKVVEAEKMEIVLTSRTSLVELNFEGGHVSFQQTSARAIKSPFFNNRYQIVILGVDVKAWIGSGFSFIQAK